MDLKRVRPATIPASQCTACEHGVYVPQPEHVPAPLRNLKPRVLEALRHLGIDIGTVERVPNGYRAHNAMMPFAWKQRDVETEIAALRRRGTGGQHGKPSNFSWAARTAPTRRSSRSTRSS